MLTLIPQALRARFGASREASHASFRLLQRLRPNAQSPKAQNRTDSTALVKLTAAALALPGLSLAPRAEALIDDPVSMQYGYYKQTPWQLLGGLKSQYSPLTVENIEGNGILTFPDHWKFSFGYVQDTWSGATPVTSAPYALGGNNPTLAGASPLVRGNGTILYDKKLTPWLLDPNSATYVPDARMVQTVASASPEIRNSGSFRLGREWEDMAFNVAGGVSDEPDYSSAYGGLNGLVNFNDKQTALNYGIDYTNSSVYALINPSYAPYVDKSYYASRGQLQVESGPNGTKVEHLTGIRQDWNFHLNLSQVVNRGLLVQTGIGFVRSQGYLANPYKAVDMVFVNTKEDPVPQPDGEAPLPPLWAPSVQAAIERRPDFRDQGIWDLRFVQYVDDFDAAVHGGYRFFIDSWGISAHTFDVDWVQPIEEWSVTPRFRYYSQSGAGFYQPYFLFSGSEPTIGDRFNLAGVPLSAYSSDWRLAAYGSVSAGVTVARSIGKAMAFEAGFEWYRHAGDLRMGGAGAGQGSWSNVDYYQFNAALRVDLSAVSKGSGDVPDNGHAGHSGHDHRQQHIGMDGPAGLLFNHMLANAGDTMVGVRYNYGFQSGDMMHGTSKVPDLQIVNQGCGPLLKCRYTPKNMDMSMVMVDIMYAPTDWMTLMLMPQFMSMDMHLRTLEGAPPPTPDDIHALHGANPFHASSGVGDIFMGSLFKLYEVPGHKIHLTAGFTAPTGSVNQRVNGNSEFEHYGMQLGTGTWNAWPSLSYNGYSGDWNWGGQLSGNVPLETHNDSGFASGTMFQSTAWGGYQLQDWLQGSVRALFTSQAQISGQYYGNFVPTGPMDMPQSYGGKFLDIGVGLNAHVKSGDFEGNHFGIEWLQPAYNDYNGYQLERKGSLWASWGLSF